MTQLLKDKEKLMKEYSDNLRLREVEIDHLKLTHEGDFKKHERENRELAKKLSERTHLVSRLESELSNLRKDHKMREEELTNEN